MAGKSAVCGNLGISCIPLMAACTCDAESHGPLTAAPRFSYLDSSYPFVLQCKKH